MQVPAEVPSGDNSRGRATRTRTGPRSPARQSSRSTGRSTRSFGSGGSASGSGKASRSRGGGGSSGGEVLGAKRPGLSLPLNLNLSYDSDEGEGSDHSDFDDDPIALRRRGTGDGGAGASSGGGGSTPRGLSSPPSGGGPSQRGGSAAAMARGAVAAPQLEPLGRGHDGASERGEPTGRKVPRISLPRSSPSDARLMASLTELEKASPTAATSSPTDASNVLSPLSSSMASGMGAAGLPGRALARPASAAGSNGSARGTSLVLAASPRTQRLRARIPLYSDNEFHARAVFLVRHRHHHRHYRHHHHRH